MNTDKTIAQQVGDRGYSDYKSLKKALKILESISEIVVQFPESSKGGTEIMGVKNPTTLGDPLSK